jgi:hypothetical protein
MIETWSEIVGLTFTQIDGAEKGRDVILFVASDGRKLKMFHSQQCCESVTVEDVIGDVADLIGWPILAASEEFSGVEKASNGRSTFYGESFTWSFYRASTIKGTLVIRWYGSSNGYYSERVELEQIKED